VISVETKAQPVASSRSFPGRSYLWLGIGLVLVGPLLLFVQLRLKLFIAPWYVAGLATAGVALLLLALLLRLTVWRIAAFVLCGLLVAGEWFFLVVLTKLPVYTGPVAVGAPFPAFHTVLANGSSFDQDGLRGSQNTALVFFRGRW
jgi:hypothetical protein